MNSNSWYIRRCCPMAINVFVNHPIVFSVANTITNQNAWCLHENCSEMDMCGIKCRVNFIEFNIFSAVDRKTVSVLSFIVYMLMIVFAFFCYCFACIILFVRFSSLYSLGDIPMVRFMSVDDACRERKKINTQQVMLGRRNWYTLGKHKQANDQVSEREHFHARTHTTAHKCTRARALVCTSSYDFIESNFHRRCTLVREHSV